jgi:flagellar motor protein MotB
MNKLLTVFLIFSSIFLSAQKMPNKWYFGFKTGLNFTKGNPYIIRGASGTTRQKGIQNEWRGVNNELGVVMSDENGDVLFYADGSRIWDGDYHELDILLQSSSSHAQMHAVKIPEQEDEYLVIHPKGTHDNVVGWYYTKITAKKGAKIIVHKENETFVKGDFMQASTIIPHCNGIDYWFVFHDASPKSSNEYVSFLIDSSGINNKVISDGIYKVPAPGKAAPEDYKSIGIMTVNSRYNVIATTFHNNEKEGVCELMEFNNETGMVVKKIAHINNFSDPNDVYGVAFSPNDSLIYLTECEGEKLNQYAIYYAKESRINASRMTLNFGKGTSARLGQIQRGPNNKLYVSLDFNGRAYDLGCNFIGEIGMPNSRGTAAKWKPEKLCVPIEFKMHLGLGLPSLPRFHIDCPQELIVEPKEEEVIIVKKIELKLNVSIGDTIILPKIIFSSNSYLLTDPVEIILVDLVSTLKQNSKLKMKIHGHTDDVGNFNANLSLSENRALAVKNFLIKKGINSNRLVSKGFGESRPKVPNINNFSRRINRRVEFIGF